MTSRRQALAAIATGALGLGTLGAVTPRATAAKNPRPRQNRKKNTSAGSFKRIDGKLVPYMTEAIDIVKPPYGLVLNISSGGMGSTDIDLWLTRSAFPTDECNDPIKPDRVVAHISTNESPDEPLNEALPSSYYEDEWDEDDDDDDYWKYHKDSHQLPPNTECGTTISGKPSTELSNIRMWVWAQYDDGEANDYYTQVAISQPHHGFCV